jgi:hypothetical protein
MAEMGAESSSCILIISLFLRRLLGRMLTKKGIYAKEKLLKKITSTRQPQNKNHVKAFLGLVGCYQKLIPTH